MIRDLEVNLKFPLITVSFVIITVLTGLLFPVSACIDPSSQYAIEIVLNKPGVSYELTLLEELVSEGRAVKVDSIYLFKYTYGLSWSVSVKGEGPLINTFEPGTNIEYGSIDFLVVVYVAKFSEGAPYVEGLSDPDKLEYYLGVRLELLSHPGIPDDVFREVFGVEGLERFISTNVFPGLLHHLVILGILSGLTWEDIENIAETARLGYAGWNNRLIYHEALGKWAPYSELVNSEMIKGVLIRGNACSIEIPEEALAAVKEMQSLFGAGIIFTLPPNYSTGPSSQSVTSEPALSETPPKSIIIKNGLFVAISIVAGVLTGLAIYLYMNRRY